MRAALVVRVGEQRILHAALSRAESAAAPPPPAPAKKSKGKEKEAPGGTKRAREAAQEGGRAKKVRR
jgi:hypothetical protein